MAPITVEVAGGLAAWSYEDVTLAAGEPHEIKDPSPELEDALAAAAAAGSLVLIEGVADMRAVETDEESLAKYAVAQEARAPLYEQRDKELAEASRNVAAIAQEKELDASERAELHNVTHSEILDKWENEMAAAAQAAVEGI